MKLVLEFGYDDDSSGVNLGEFLHFSDRPLNHERACVCN